MSVTEAGLETFLENPSAYFEYSATRMLTLPRAELDELQFKGIQKRFAQHRRSIPMLERLADSQGIQEIKSIEDVPPLLFDHATYKSYPSSLLDNHNYRQLTNWLNKLTTHDLSSIDVSACRSIDDWILTLKHNTPMAVCHTSGTSGTISFLPWSKSEFHRTMYQWLILFFQRFGAPGKKPDVPLNIDCVYPYYRDGGQSNCRANDSVVKFITGSEERFHAAYPGYISADLIRLAAQYRAAVSRGTVSQLKISPELQNRRAQFLDLQRDMPKRAAEFLDEMCGSLAGKRVMIWGITNLVYAMAENGLKKGIRKLFTPDSVIVTGGGGKGTPLPSDYKEVIQEFLGVERVNVVYGMSETAGSPMVQCEHGHYHGLPSLVPFVLDGKTNEMLPRRGRTTGRFASFDLVPDSHWGGFISGDEVTMEWDEPCPCGRATPYLTGTIQRFSEKQADTGEEKINCAATPAAYEEALDFLISTTP